MFSVIDIIQALTGNERPRKYWSDLKKKLQVEGSEVSDKIGQLKMLAPDGKSRLTDVACTEILLRLIQSIPSPRAEPFKLFERSGDDTQLLKLISSEMRGAQAV